MQKITEGSIVELHNLRIEGEKVIYTPMNIYLGILPTSNLTWFPSTPKPTITKLVALNDFTENYTKNIFSVKHLTHPLNDFDSIEDDNIRASILLELLNK